MLGCTLVSNHQNLAAPPFSLRQQLSALKNMWTAPNIIISQDLDFCNISIQFQITTSTECAFMHISKWILCVNFLYLKLFISSLPPSSLSQNTFPISIFTLSISPPTPTHMDDIKNAPLVGGWRQQTSEITFRLDLDLIKTLWTSMRWKYSNFHSG